MPESLLIISYTTGSRAIYYREIVTPAGNQRTLSAAIGAPLEVTDNVVCEPLPDISLPAGAKVQVIVNNPETGDITFLIED